MSATNERGGRILACLMLVLLSSTLPVTLALAQDQGESGGDRVPMGAPVEAPAEAAAAPEADTQPPPRGEETATGDAAGSEDEIAGGLAAMAPPEISVSIPTIDAVDSSIDEAALREVFSGNIADHAMELAALDATSITIPEIRLHIGMQSPETGEAMEEEIVYHDIVISDVSGGVAEKVSVGGADISIGPDIALTLNEMSAANFDIGGMLGFYGVVPGAAGGEIKTIYTDLLLEGGNFTSPEVDCDFGAVSTAEFKARPTRFSYLDIVSVVTRMGDDDTPPLPEDIATIVDFYADLLTAFESSPTRFDGFKCDATDSAGTPTTVSLGTVTIGAFSGGRYPDITATDFAFDAQNAEASSNDRFTFASFILKGFDLTPIIATLQQAEGHIDEAWLEANGRSLVPPFEGASLSGFDMDVAQPETPEERLQVSVEAFDLSLSHYVNGIPADVTSTGTHVVSPLPPEIAGVPVKALIGAGIDKLDLRFALDFAWDEATRTYAVNTLSVGGEQLGDIALSAMLGNAVAALFAVDPTEQQQAAMAVTLKTFNLDIRDEGMADIMWQAAAAMEGTDVAAFKESISGVAQGLLLATLGGSPQVMQLSNSIAAFIDGASHFSLTLTSKDPEGIGAVEAMALQSTPAVLTEKMNIEASAE